MAKSKSMAMQRVRSGGTIVIRERVAAVGGRIKRGAGRGLRRLGSHVIEQKHEYAAVGGAGLLGLMERENITLPTFGLPLTNPQAATLYAFAAAKLLKSKMARRATTGFACISIYELAKGSK